MRFSLGGREFIFIQIGLSKAASLSLSFFPIDLAEYFGA
jgi:hypothetical protein